MNVIEAELDQVSKINIDAMNKFDRDNLTAYIRRKRAEEFLSRYYPLGIEVICQYPAGVEFFLPIHLKKQYNEAISRKSGNMGHSMIIQKKMRPYPITKLVEARFEFRDGYSHQDPNHYLKMPNDEYTGNAIEDVKRFFGKSWMLYLSSPGSLKNYKDFDYYMLISVSSLLKNWPYFKYSKSEDNERRVVIYNWNPTWLSIKGSSKGFFSKGKDLGTDLLNIFKNGD